MSLSFALHDTAASTATEIYEPIASSNSPSSRESANNEAGMRSKGNTGRQIYGDRRNTTSRVSTRDFSDWLAEQAIRYSEKELAGVTGLSIKGAQNLRAGKSGAKGSTLSTWCLNDPMFAMAYGEYVGIIKPGHAEFMGRLAQAALASQRLQMGGDAE